jgi:flagellar hook-length control protein FliK
VISQLVEKAELLVKGESSEIVVSLKPEYLGRITLRASVVDDAVLTTILTQSADVKSLLESDLPELQRQLQDAGLNAVRVVVARETDIGSGHSGLSHSWQHAYQDPPAQQHGSTFRHPDAPQYSRMYDRQGVHTEPDLQSANDDPRYIAGSIHFIA